MADYYFPTVVTPMIPVADVSPLDALVLGEMFACERDGDTYYYFAPESVDEMPTFDIADVRAALHASRRFPSGLAALIEDELSKLDPAEQYLQLDLTMSSWPSIFQDIIKRSVDLTHITVVSAFTCSRMQPDGFGGMVTVITADAVLSTSTDEMAAQLLGQAQYGYLGCAPGYGVHVLTRLVERDVRSTLGEIIANDPDYASIKTEHVTDADMRRLRPSVCSTRASAWRTPKPSSPISAS